MPLSPRTCALALALGLAIATSCASPPQSVARQAVQPTLPTRTARLAPSVSSPRDIRLLVPSPCQKALTPQELGQRRYELSGRPSVVAAQAPSCTWNGTAPNKSLDVTVWTTRDYLEDAYRQPIYRYFRPVEIEGLPAAEQQTESGPSLCDVTVGVGERQALDVMIDIEDVEAGRPAVDPCGEARAVVALVVAKLPPA